MRKEALVDLDVTDAGGDTLSVLSTSGNGELACEAIIWLLRQLPSFEDGLEEEVREVVFETSLTHEIAQARPGLHPDGRRRPGAGSAGGVTPDSRGATMAP